MVSLDSLDRSTNAKHNKSSHSVCVCTCAHVCYYLCAYVGRWNRASDASESFHRLLCYIPSTALSQRWHYREHRCTESSWGWLDFFSFDLCSRQHNAWVFVINTETRLFWYLILGNCCTKPFSNNSFFFQTPALMNHNEKMSTIMFQISICGFRNSFISFSLFLEEQED